MGHRTARTAICRRAIANDGTIIVEQSTGQLAGGQLLHRQRRRHIRGGRVVVCGGGWVVIVTVVVGVVVGVGGIAAGQDDGTVGRMYVQVFAYMQNILYG